jgi:hypothetical protein
MRSSVAASAGVIPDARVTRAANGGGSGASTPAEFGRWVTKEVCRSDDHLTPGPAWFISFFACVLLLVSQHQNGRLGSVNGLHV